jgi:hypothetical protein
MIPETQTLARSAEAPDGPFHLPSPKVQIALEQMLRLPVPIAFIAGTFPAVS